MLPPIWPVFKNVIFDCDSTLAAIEGIDELARLTGNGDDIALLTKRAMEGDIPLEAVYGHRLGTANPTQAQVRQIAQRYRETVVPGAREVVEALQAMGVNVFIVSGGLLEPVRDFGTWLGIPRDRIFAVGMEYDQLAGQWWRYWDQPSGENPRARYLAHESNPLVSTGGKAHVIAARIRSLHPGRSMLVGDGGSDLEAAPAVDLFVGFGGAVYRERVAMASPVFLRTLSLAPILPLALGQLGNTPQYARLWADGLVRIHRGEAQFLDPELKDRFTGAMRRGALEI